jgi:hypothetical protein
VVNVGVSLQNLEASRLDSRFDQMVMAGRGQMPAWQGIMRFDQMVMAGRGQMPAWQGIIGPD